MCHSTVYVNMYASIIDELLIVLFFLKYRKVARNSCSFCQYTIGVLYQCTLILLSECIWIVLSTSEHEHPLSSYNSEGDPM